MFLDHLPKWQSGAAPEPGPMAGLREPSGIWKWGAALCKPQLCSPCSDFLWSPGLGGWWLMTEHSLPHKPIYMAMTASMLSLAMRDGVCTVWCILFYILFYSIFCSFIFLWAKIKTQGQLCRRTHTGSTHWPLVRTQTWTLEDLAPFSDSLLGTFILHLKSQCGDFPKFLNILWKHYFNGSIIIFPLAVFHNLCNHFCHWKFRSFLKFLMFSSLLQMTVTTLVHNALMAPLMISLEWIPGSNSNGLKVTGILRCQFILPHYFLKWLCHTPLQQSLKASASPNEVLCTVDLYQTRGERGKREGIDGERQRGRERGGKDERDAGKVISLITN